MAIWPLRDVLWERSGKIVGSWIWTEGRRCCWALILEKPCQGVRYLHGAGEICHQRGACIYRPAHHPSALPVFSLPLSRRLGIRWVWVREGDGQEGMCRGLRALWVLTLILQLESWPVLGVVAVEIQSGLVGCRE